MEFRTSVIKEREKTQAIPAIFEREFTKENCLEIINYSKKNIYIDKAEIGDENAMKSELDDFRKSDIGWIRPNNETNFIFTKILEKTNQVNKFYNFDLVGVTEPIQFTSYNGEQKHHFDWHLDMGGGYFSRRKLSLVIQLSDENDYQGGELEIDIASRNKELIIGPKKRGSMIFFPSYLKHRVKPVISGHRYSLVSWISGHPFR